MTAPKPRVLVTRSEPGASETAQRLTGRSYQPIVEPLFRVEPIPAKLPPFDALAFTSANGVRAFAPLSPRRDVPVYCVGARTAETAREAGFVQIVSANGDVKALAMQIDKQLAPNARLLHVGNEESHGDLAGNLTSKGRYALFIPTYRAVPVDRPGPMLARHLAGDPAFEAVLIHSPRASAILQAFLAPASARAPFRAAAISARAAASLEPFAARIETAVAPDEAALLLALDRLFAAR